MAMNAPAITATPTIMQNAIERYSFALFIAINEIGGFDNIANVQKNSIGGDVVASCIYFLDCFLYLL